MPSITKKPTKKKRPGDDKPPFQKLFELLCGCEFTGSGDNLRGVECPFCGGSKFYANVATGQYQCKSANNCGESGNAYSFIRWYYAEQLAATTDRDLKQLKLLRGLPLQTIKRHGIAWDSNRNCWLVPYKSEKGEVQNLLRYFANGKKFVLPGVPLRLYGLDQLQNDISRVLLVFEGAWDAIAADHHLREKKTRDRFDILAVPSANVFFKEWCKYCEHRTVRGCLDNDKAGRDGQQRIAKLLLGENKACKVSVLNWPADYPEKCDIGDLIKDGISIAEFTNEHCKPISTATPRIILTRGDEIDDEKVEWFWQGHIPFGSLVDFSGPNGTQKSTIAKVLAAYATAGLPMPNSEARLTPFTVYYFTSEDRKSRVKDLVRIHDGDLTRLHVYDISDTDEPIDLLENLEGLAAQMKADGVRLVVLDALNSFCGGDISSDAKARRSLSGRLHSLARRTGACIIGIRNWGRMDVGTASQRALGAVSLAAVARCQINTRELRAIKGKGKRFALEWEKLSDAPTPEPIPYTVEDLSTCDDNSHYRRIIWGKPGDIAKEMKELVSAKKGSTKR